MNQPIRILIVEDEDALANGLKFNFEAEGYDAEVARDGDAGLAAFRQADPPFDLIILDIMLPGASGYEVCQSIRADDDVVPILVLSARTLSADKTQAFDCGSDQYMTKPFALPELLSRARNLVERHRGRRATSEPDRTPEVRSFGSVQFDYRRYKLTTKGETHSLTKYEAELLQYFLAHDDLVLSRSQILEEVWGETADITTRTIDNFVMRLRKLIEESPSEPKHILSVRGTGYRFVSQPTVSE
ncbi:MAG: response regulator transcription factor [Planctomycetota bacterium]|nr:response regulator transcription factor [Planctomycetota bacterium]